MVKYICFIGGFLTFFLCFATVSFARIFITEVHPTDEYIEFYNEGEYILNTEHLEYSEFTGGGKEKKYSFPSASILANTYFVIHLSRKINDSGDTISLYDTSEQIDQIVIPEKEEGKSYQNINEEWVWEVPSIGEENDKTSDETEEEIEENEISENEENTDDNQNNENNENNTGNIEEDVESSSEADIDPDIEIIPVILSEILPNPEGSDSGNEWIELYNPNESEASLLGWSIQDASQKQYFFPEITLNPFEYKIFVNTVSLNNTNEKLILINPKGDIVSTMQYEKSTEGEGIILHKGLWQNTETPTPNAENIYLETDGEESSTVNIQTDPFQVFETIEHKEINTLLPTLNLQITKVSPNSSQDFIEVKCVACNQSLEGVQIGTDRQAFILNEDVFASTGDMIRFVFSNEIQSSRKVLNGWIIYINKSGLTSTDETVFITDASSNILDAMCYANYDEYFPSQEKKDLSILWHHNQWKGVEEISEYSCIQSSGLARDGLITRTGLVDTNTKDDWSINIDRDNKKHDELQNQSHNIYQLRFESFVFDREFTQITIKNTDTRDIPLHEYFISNKKDHLMNLSEDEQYLAPGQTALIMLPKNKTKKYIRNNMTLELRNGKNELTDFFCINLSSSQSDVKDKEKAMIFIDQAQRIQLWEQSKKQTCATWNTGNSILYSRKIYEFPSSLSAYEKTEYQAEKDENQNNNEILEHEESNMTVTKEESEEESEEEDAEEEKKDEMQINTISITPEKNKIIFSGHVENDVSSVEFSIPKRNLKWIEKVKKGEVYSELSYPLQKRWYALDITLIKKDKTQIPLERSRFYLLHNILPDRVFDIEIAKILPNPEGKDSGNEVITFYNSSATSGWFRDMKLVLEGGKNPTVKTLPDVFIEGNEFFQIPDGFIQSLRNTNAKLSLTDEFGNSLASISWEKARNGEWFGSFAPEYIVPVKTKKASTTKQKKSSTKKTVNSAQKITPGSTEETQKESLIRNAVYITEFAGQMIFRDEYGYWHSINIDDYFPQNSDLFAYGSEFIIEINRNNKFKSIVPFQPILAADIFGFGGLQENYNTENFSRYIPVGLGVSLILFGGIGFWIRKRDALSLSL